MRKVAPLAAQPKPTSNCRICCFTSALAVYRPREAKHALKSRRNVFSPPFVFPQAAAGIFDNPVDAFDTADFGDFAPHAQVAGFMGGLDRTRSFD